MSFDWNGSKILTLAAIMTLLVLALKVFGPSPGAQPSSPAESLWVGAEIVPYSRPRGETAPQVQALPPRPSAWNQFKAMGKSLADSLRQTLGQPEPAIETSEFTHDGKGEEEDAEKDAEEDSEEDTEWAESDELDSDEELMEDLISNLENEAHPPQQKSSDAQKENHLSDLDQTPGLPLSGDGLTAQKQGNTEEEAQDGEAQLRLWTVRLTQQPDFSALTQLVAAYQAGQISTTVFYSVLDEMLEDSRQEVRSLAAIALVSTPSTSSFIRIADLLNQEAYNSSLRGRLEQGLDYYNDLNYLVTLEPVLWQSDQPHVLQLAIQQIQIAAQFHFDQDRSLALDPESSSQATSLPQRAVLAFSRFLQPLRDLNQRQAGQDQELQAQTQSTLSSLESFLSSNVSLSQHYSLDLED